MSCLYYAMGIPIETEVIVLHKDAVWKLALFNGLLVVGDVVLFSKGLVNLMQYPVAAIAAGAVSAALFIGVNYWILNDAGTNPGFHSGKLKDVDDYENALEFWVNKSNPFRNDAKAAISQLRVFRKKKYALKALLGDQAKEEGSPFLSVSDDVESCLLTNMKRLLNRMTIIDPAERTKFPIHAEYIRHILAQNSQILTEYDNLVIEISQIGDSTNVQSLQLEAITQALRELRDDQETPAAQAVQESES